MEPLYRKELVHKHPGMKDADFMMLIDATGGWPVGYKYVQFYHSAEYAGRTCVFTNIGANTGYYTTVCSADDYYWWKLSDEKKKDVVKEAKRQLITQINGA